ncbi:uncharacterized protein LOC119548539 isoform X2 [Drosophila subpulchrella]|uniref:uncharacterized protein LOC119548539 isoform X2 n=1 Tax=Drosophila subpulchrella TaxID=1486046 RepID=UPI0018A1738E|nr:uncharacterized protein LOC119548539 isoform X2 [Drosophila subpulchrella]
MLPLQIVLLGCLLIAEGLCHTLPEVKVRTPRDTSSIPTSFFKPVGENSAHDRSLVKGGNHTLSRFRRDTSNIPTDFFKPVGERSSNEPNSDRSPSNGGNGTALRGGIEFFERSSAEVEEVTASYEDEDVPIRNSPFQDRPIYPQSAPRFSPPKYGDTFQTDYSADPRGSNFNNRPFPRTPVYRDSGIPSFPESPFRDQISSTWGPRPIPTVLGGSMVPLFSGGPSMSVGRSGPNGSGGSPDNFFRSESYSYTSDGRGPPQIQRGVYDSRDGMGSSFRNF